MLSQSIDSHLPKLARVCARTLLLAYLLTQFFLLLPLSPLSPDWGSQLSSRILDGAPVPLLAVALLRYASLAEPSPDPQSEPEEAMEVARRRHNAVQLCKLGVISLSLLAVWQFALLSGSLTALEQRNSNKATQESRRLRQSEQSIIQASGVQIDQVWQELMAAGAPGLGKPVSGTEQRRERLLEAIKTDQQQLVQGLREEGNRARFTILRERLRNLGLCLIYVLGFDRLGRQWL